MDKLKGLFETGLIQKLLDNKLVLALVVICVIIITELAQYKSKAYYSQRVDVKNKERMNAHPLNKKFNFNKKRDLDEDKLNFYILISHLICLAIGAVVMILWNTFYGFILFAVLMIIVDYLVAYYIGKHPELVTINKKKIKYSKKK